MATRSSTLAWRILWTEKPGGLQSSESQRVSLTEHALLINPHPPPPFPFGNHTFVFYICESVSQTNSLY